MSFSFGAGMSSSLSGVLVAERLVGEERDGLPLLLLLLNQRALSPLPHPDSGTYPPVVIATAIVMDPRS